MSSLAARDFPGYPQASHAEKVHSLLLLNQAAQKINCIHSSNCRVDGFGEPRIS